MGFTCGENVRKRGICNELSKISHEEMELAQLFAARKLVISCSSVSDNSAKDFKEMTQRTMTLTPVKMAGFTANVYFTVGT